MHTSPRRGPIKGVEGAQLVGLRYVCTPALPPAVIVSSLVIFVMKTRLAYLLEY